MASIQAARGPGTRGGIVGINVTPFVDIALVLLIIMMVSSTYIVSQALKVELPKTATSDGKVTKTYVVTIDKGGELRFNDAPATLKGLEASLREARASEDVSLVISADQAALHGRVVEIIDTAKLAGITKFAINVERSK
ncbi:MAG: biopolymer transporter ExbD [Labilithrix sp.]|nr:biopolymer transporter ExbD [Labilithrix sp.]